MREQHKCKTYCYKFNGFNNFFIFQQQVFSSSKRNFCFGVFANEFKMIRTVLNARNYNYILKPVDLF